MDRLRSITVGARNDGPWTPGRVRVNGQEGGFITGPATVTWRRRDGAVPVVVFDGDDDSFGNVSVRLVITADGNIVKEVAGIKDEVWAFQDEKDINGGVTFNNLTFDIFAQKPGFQDSMPIRCHATRRNV